VKSCPDIDTIVVAVPPGWEERAAGEVGREARVVPGGDTRQRSVAAGLEALERAGEQPEAVICHDVARPRAPAELFEAVLRALSDADGAVPAIPVVDTLKRVRDGVVVETVPRTGMVMVQTPQAFRWEALRTAHQRAGRDGVDATDDASLLERAGYRVALVEGDPANIKITGPADLALVAGAESGGG
jgi:2-C-methyl-D-erythritol 4-phosphate cytidylyltransferase/2-C-methyl-D-erythritol 2,4-cyclodiphosphate synthase